MVLGRGAATRASHRQNGRCRMHGGKSPGAPKGIKNALKHGRYSAEATSRRQEVARRLLRAGVKATDCGPPTYAKANTKEGRSRLDHNCDL